MSNIDFSQPQRQSVKGLVLIFLQEGKRGIQIFWPVIVGILFAKHSDKKILILGAFVLLAAILTLIHAILYFRAFKFHIENQQFILNKGYLGRKTLTIPLDRIQNVNTNQTVFQQFLGVMSVEIDTAGTSQKELKILALTQPVAVELSRILSSYVEIQPAENVEASGSAPSEEKLVLRLTNRDLLKIGISQNHLKTAAILFFFGMQFYNQVKQYFKEKAEEYAHEAAVYLSQSGWAILMSLVLFFLLLSLLYSMARTAILFYDLRFYKLNLSYRIVSGLLTRKNMLIPFRKIQQLNWETGPLKKLFGIYRVTVHQATSELTTKTKLIEMPGCLDKHIELLKEDLFGADELKDQPVIRSSKVYLRRTWLYKGWLPGVLATPLMFLDWRVLFGILLWIILMFFYSRLTLKKSYFQISNGQIRVSSGAVEHHFKQMELHKVQHLEFSQSYFYKKRGVASLKIGNASGFIRLPFIDERIARALHDYLLYYAETSDRVWM